MLAFALGVLCLYLLPAVFAPGLLFALAACIPAALIVPRLRLPLCAFAAGALLAAAHISWDFAHRPPAELAGESVTLTGTVIGLVEHTGGRQRFVVEPERLAPYPAGSRLPRRVRLSWYHGAERVEAGERWRWPVRLKRPRGLANPVAFSYEDWLGSKAIDATGYVRGAGERLGRRWSIAALRSTIAARLHAVLEPGAGRAIASALAVGDRREITDAQWQRLRATGTTHLVAISGLHVGIIAAVAGGLAWALARVWPALLARRAAPLAAALAALVAAVCYAALAGFAVSTLRALFMLGLLVLVWMCRRRPSARGIWLAALVCFAMFRPEQVLGVGLWLSLGAVALIGWTMRGIPERMPAWRRVLAVQLAVTIGLVPLTLAFFGQLAWLSLPVNLVSVPLFSVLLVPAALAAAVLDLLWPAVGAPLLGGVGWLLQCWYDALGSLTGALGATAPAIPAAAAWGALAASLWLLFVTGRWRVLLAAGVPLPMLWALATTVPPAPPLELTVLDVGQGSAAVLRSGRTTWVYDTGPAWGALAVARFTLVPFLTERGIRRVRRLVISHGDSDHAGGVETLAKTVAIESRLAGEPNEIAGAGRCRRGGEWRLGAARVRALWPPPGEWQGNQASCVLLLSVAGRRVLLAGDLEADAEARLVRSLPGPVDVVLVPHHGSKDASGGCLVAATKPLLAVISAGHDNAYGMPAEAVVDRYRRAGAVVANTAEVGAVTVTIRGDGSMSSRQRRPASRKLHHERAAPGFRLPARIHYAPPRSHMREKKRRPVPCGS